MKTSISLVSLTLALGTTSAFADPSNDSHPVLPAVEVSSPPLTDTPFMLAPTGDSARLLDGHPGYSTATGGGVSGMPVVNGLADDRIKIRIDGMEITSACGNHMNVPLSYTDPKLIGSLKLYPGISPVSVGGDNIGGTIEVRSADPLFADTSELLTTGQLSASTRSVNHQVSMAANATIASDNLSLSYNGSHSKADSYRDGNGHKVLASMFESNNQVVTLAVRGDGHQVALRVGDQRIPYQGFPNQYMDMTNNQAVFANLAYNGQYSWGKLEAKAYAQKTDHTMGFFSREKPGTMPMETEGRDIGYTIKAELPLQGDDVLRLGHEFHKFMLDDWWPPVPASMMMGPNTFVNINNGQRSRTVLFGEWEGKLADQVNGLFGARHEHVQMNSGHVQAYGVGMMHAADVAAANAFNASDRKKTDNNLDLTALLRFTPSRTFTSEVGVAQKTRSPSIYERYTWGRGTMAMMMNNWYGDGNGYAGDINLKPEVAHTLSISSSWHDADKKQWHFTASPYYSRVKNYIDADATGTFNAYSNPSAPRNLLQLANHDAILYGINLSWQMPLASTHDWGDWQIRGQASYTRGKRTDGGDLYRIMPLNTLLTLEQHVGAWTNTLDAKLVAAKTNTDDRRLEQKTSGYTLFNLRTRYQLTAKTSLTAGISNLFDRKYDDPTGGVYLSGLKAAGAGAMQVLPGYGRSLDLGVTVGF